MRLDPIVEMSCHSCHTLPIKIIFFCLTFRVFGEGQCFFGVEVPEKKKKLKTETSWIGAEKAKASQEAAYQSDSSNSLTM